MIDEEESTGLDAAGLRKSLADRLRDRLADGAYARTIAEALRTAVLLEQAIDMVLLTTLAPQDRWAADLLRREVLGQMGRHRKIELLGKILQHQPADLQDTAANLINKIKSLFQLRDMIAHSGFVDAGPGDALQLSGYRQWKRQSHSLAHEQTDKVLSDAFEALVELLQYP